MFRYFPMMAPARSTMIELLKWWPSGVSSAYPRDMPMPYSAARSNSGRVTALGISCSNQVSTSAWSSMYQRGKKGVRASSGKTMRVAPALFASSIKASIRPLTASRASVFGMGPVGIGKGGAVGGGGGGGGFALAGADRVDPRPVDLSIIGAVVQQERDAHRGERRRMETDEGQARIDEDQQDQRRHGAEEID